MTAYDPKSRYDALFPNDRTKAESFDKIAEKYYFQNFGTIQKAEIDLLLFSEYMDRIYKASGDAPNDYSNYTISKLLGITESRVASLKEKKEVKYPSEYDWRQEFLSLLEKAEFKDDKVRIFVRDGRLYSVLCNLVEEMGSYSETTLTRRLLVVSPPVFVDLMIEASPNKDKEEMRNKLAIIFADNKLDSEAYVTKRMTVREALRESSSQIIENVMLAVVDQIPIAGPVVYEAAKGVLSAIKKAYSSNKSKSKE